MAAGPMPARVTLPEPDLATLMLADGGGAARQQHSRESQSWSNAKNVALINVEMLKKTVEALQQCSASFSEVKQGIRAVLTQIHEQHHLRDLETAVSNNRVGPGSEQEDASADTMHEWLNNIESEFAWLKQRLADNHHVQVTDSPVM